jgi:hypothetical protein
MPRPRGGLSLRFAYILIHSQYRGQIDSLGKSGDLSYNLGIMKKNAPLAFRISSELKKNLQQIADREARSISQICEILLTIGADTYEKDGPRYLQRFLGRQKDG